MRRTVALGVLCSLAAPAAAEATFPGENGLLAFEVRDAGTSTSQIAVAPAPEPGAGRAVEVTRITPPGVDSADPAWSPDGTTLAYTTNRDGDYDLHVMDADGRNDRRLTGPGAPETDPAWSPDGTRIAFTRVVAGNADLYVMAAAGGTARRLTTGPAADRAADWSSRDLIAFESDRDGSTDLFTMAPDGSAQTARVATAGFDGDPSWSPDGRVLAHTTRTARRFEIRAADAASPGADGRYPRIDVRQLPASSGDQTFPAWSPDGLGMAYTGSLSPARPRGPGAFDIATGRNSDWAVVPFARPARRPEAATTANVEPVSGEVLVTVPESEPAVELPREAELPEQTTLDTTSGTARVETVDARGRTDAVVVSGGVAELVLAGPAARPVTDLELARPTGCAAAPRAVSAASRRSARRRNRVRARHRGPRRVRTSGKYLKLGSTSTDWTTIEECTRTIVRVDEGTVRAYDRVRRRIRFVRPGQELCVSRRDTAFGRTGSTPAGARCRSGRTG